MNDRPRKPAAFSLPADAAAQQQERIKPRPPASFDDAVTLTPDADDPFIATTAGLPELAPPVAAPRPPGRPARFSASRVTARFRPTSKTSSTLGRFA